MENEDISNNKHQTQENKESSDMNASGLHSQNDVEHGSNSSVESEEVNAEYGEMLEEIHDSQVDLYPSQQPGFVRDDNWDLQLPESVKILTTEEGCKVYLVATNHCCRKSQAEVLKTIELIKPDFVMLELCKHRVDILDLDEETMLDESENLIKLRTILITIQEHGFQLGITNLLLHRFYAKLTRQSGILCGGEFKIAFEAAKNIKGCRVVLGDRDVNITLERALASLNWLEKIVLAFCIVISTMLKVQIEEDDEDEADFTEEELREINEEFAPLVRVLVEERDLYLARSLRNTARLLPPVRFNDCEDTTEIKGIPSVVVGVVGLDHTPGIAQHWNTVQDMDLKYLFEVPKNESSIVSSILKWALIAALFAFLSWFCYDWTMLAHLACVVVYIIIVWVFVFYI